MEEKIHAVGQIAELLNNTIKKEYQMIDRSLQEVIVNHLFENDEVQLIKKKFLKIISEI